MLGVLAKGREVCAPQAKALFVLRFVNGGCSVLCDGDAPVSV